MEPMTINRQHSEGLEIQGKHWPQANPRAVVCLVHGLGEHIGRYGHVAEFFIKNGMAVAGFDLPGFGRSEGKRGHARQLETYLEVVKCLTEMAGEWYPGVPLFLYGQSMGGNIVLNYLLDRGNLLKGAIASSPWIRLPKPPSSLLVSFAKLMFRIYPSFSQGNGLDVNELSNDPAVIKAYAADRLVHDRISVSTAIAMLEAARRLDTFSGKIPAPALLMHGSDDLITDPKGSEYFARRTTGSVTFKAWEGLKHELHNEPEQQEILTFALQWMEGVLKAKAV